MEGTLHNCRIRSQYAHAHVHTHIISHSNVLTLTRTHTKTQTLSWSHEHAYAPIPGHVSTTTLTSTKVHRNTYSRRRICGYTTFLEYRVRAQWRLYTVCIQSSSWACYTVLINWTFVTLLSMHCLYLLAHVRTAQMCAILHTNSLFTRCISLWPNCGFWSIVAFYSLSHA